MRNVRLEVVSLPGRGTFSLTSKRTAGLTMAVVASLIAVSCTCPLASLSAPPAKATSTPTKTPKPSSSPMPTQTAVPPPTPTSTVTFTATEASTVTPMDTPTHTPVPPLATAQPPTSTPTRAHPSPTSAPKWDFAYLEGSMETRPNCGSVYLEGEIRNSAGVPMDGITVRLRWWDHVEYELSGLAGGHSSGKWGFSPLSPDQNRAYQSFFLDIVESSSNPVPLSLELPVEMVNCSQAGQFTNIIFASAR